MCAILRPAWQVENMPPMNPVPRWKAHKRHSNVHAGRSWSLIMNCKNTDPSWGAVRRRKMTVYCQVLLSPTSHFVPYNICVILTCKAEGKGFWTKWKPRNRAKKIQIGQISVHVLLHCFIEPRFTRTNRRSRRHAHQALPAHGRPIFRSVALQNSN